MLYFIRAQKYLKIGYSQDFNTLVDRMLSYMTHNPDFILLSFTEFGTVKDESTIHKLLKEFQYYTEWYVAKKNLIPKNCFYQFPDDIQKLKELNYKEVWDSPLIPDFDYEDKNAEEQEIYLLKYFGTYKTFTSEDFTRACKFCEKELNIKISKTFLEEFGYIFNEFTDELVTLKKIKFTNINL